MRKGTSSKLIVFKNKQGETLRVLQCQSEHLNLVKNIETKRIELVDTQFEYEESHVLLQKVSLSNIDINAINLKNYGTLSLQKEDEHSRLDPQLIDTEEAILPLPLTVKWSSISHGVVLGILVLFYLLMPQKKSMNNTIKEENLVTIQLEKPEPKKEQTNKEIKPKKEVTSSIPKQKKKITVVPRINKKNPLKVTKSTPIKVKTKTIKPKYNTSKVASAPRQKPNKVASPQFKRLGTLSALSSALKGTQAGSGSGLRLNNKNSTGGFGTGSGIGKGKGTMGHGFDSGGGYEQALYGKGLIAGQVGAGTGGLGSGWGKGRAGSGSYGTKGKGGGHDGYGTSRIGSGASTFSFPVTEEALIEGGLDREAVIMVVMKNIGQITYCYELGLQKKPHLRGRVLVDFTINGEGRVSAQSIESSSLKSSQVETCMLSKIKNWKFPRPVGGVNVEVNYPFSLQRVSDVSQNLTAK